MEGELQCGSGKAEVQKFENTKVRFSISKVGKREVGEWEMTKSISAKCGSAEVREVEV